MLQAVADDFAQITGIHVTTLVDHLVAASPGHACRRVAPDEEADAFRDCASRADATLVIAPECDDVLQERSRWVLEAGGRLLGSLPVAVRLAGDKDAVHRHWQARAVRTPATVHASSSPPTAFGPPWVCKPRRGAGSQATFLVGTAADWPAVFAQAVAAWPTGELLAQPFVAGSAASVSFLLGPDQCAPLMSAAQHLSDDGRFQYRGGRVPLPPPLGDRAVCLAQSALMGIDGLQGYLGVDLVLGAPPDGSEDYAIEINPRLTTSYIGLRRLCRDNLAEAWLDVRRGATVKLGWGNGAVEFDPERSVRG
jgi:tyramine---L-glutamate ligase